MTDTDALEVISFSPLLVKAPAGPPNTLGIGTVERGDQAGATITGEAPNQTLNLTLPAGDPGVAASVTIGTVTTGSPGTDATVTNSGTSTDAVLDFTIPKGDTGSGDVSSVNSQAPDSDGNVTLTPSNIGAVPTSRTVAGHALTADVVVAYTDITGTPDLTTKADLVGGVVPTSQIPVIALNTSVTVADQAAMLALTSSQVQPGDLAIRGDGAGTFMLMATDPSVLSNWKLLDAPADAVSSVNGQTGVVVLGASDVNALAITDTRVAPPPTVADAGKVVTVKADGSGYGLDAGGGALTTASATLATTATPATSSNFTYQTIPALAAGTWLVTVTAAVKPATAGLVLIRTSVTGTATIVGQSTIQDTNAATNGYTSLVATWLLGADGGSTVDLQASLNGGGSILGSAAYTGWIAVKIA